MNEIARPFFWVWQYFGRIGGVPGQAFLIVLIILLGFGFFIWLGNRK